jgi:hypothetical protein
MSGIYDNQQEMIAAMDEFFANHPELPRINEVWDVIGGYIYNRQLTPTLPNFESALKACRQEIENALDNIPPKAWLDKVVKPEFKQRQAAQPERIPEKPWGVSTTQWIHSR